MHRRHAHYAPHALALALLANSACADVLGLSTVADADGAGGATSTSVGGSSSSSVVASSGSAAGGAGGMGGAGGANLPPGYVDEVLADTPVAYYRFGSAAPIDSVVGSVHGLFGGSATTLLVGGALLGGDDDGATEFAGDAWVLLGDVFDFASAAPFSIELWMKVDSGLTGAMALAHKQASNQGWRLELQPGDGGGPEPQVHFIRKQDNNNDQVSGYNLELGEFHHIVGSYDGSQIRLYVDGSQVDFTGADKVLVDTTQPLALGAKADGNTPFVGALDEVAIYDKALPAVRVGAHHDAALSR